MFEALDKLIGNSSETDRNVTIVEDGLTTVKVITEQSELTVPKWGIMFLEEGDIRVKMLSDDTLIKPIKGKIVEQSAYGATVYTIKRDSNESLNVFINMSNARIVDRYVFTAGYTPKVGDIVYVDETVNGIILYHFESKHEFVPHFNAGPNYDVHLIMDGIDRKYVIGCLKSNGNIRMRISYADNKGITLESLDATEFIVKNKSLYSEVAGKVFNNSCAGEAIMIIDSHVNIDANALQGDNVVLELVKAVKDTYFSSGDVTEREAYDFIDMLKKIYDIIPIHERDSFM